VEAKGAATLIQNIPWLPDIVSVDGAWEETLTRLYAIFSRDFIRTRLQLNTLEVWHDRRRIDGNYEEGFWHLITREEKTTRTRNFDPRRAERLPWSAPVIRNNSDGNVKCWRYKEGNGKIRFYLWLFNLDYVVILEERTLQPLAEKPSRTIAMLVTSFYVDSRSKREDLERKFAKREA
jgi:hypothetical protein